MAVTHPTQLTNRALPRRRVSVTLVIGAVMLALGFGAGGIVWMALKASRQGSQQMQRVLQASRVQEDVRALEPALAKLLAFSQLIGQGDLSFQQDLTQHLERVDATITHLESLGSALSEPEQSVLQQINAQWQACQRSVGGVLALSGGMMLGEQALLIQDAVRKDVDQLQFTLTTLSHASARHWGAATTAAGQWSFDVRRQSLFWAGGFLLVLVLSFAALWWRVLRPLYELRRAVDAFVTESRRYPLAIASNDEFGELAIAWNQLIETQRSRIGSAGASVATEVPAELPVVSDHDPAVRTSSLT